MSGEILGGRNATIRRGLNQLAGHPETVCDEERIPLHLFDMQCRCIKSPWYHAYNCSSAIQFSEQFQLAYHLAARSGESIILASQSLFAIVDKAVHQASHSQDSSDDGT